MPVLASQAPPEETKVDTSPILPDLQLAKSDLAPQAEFKDGHGRVESVERCYHLLAQRGNRGVDGWLWSGSLYCPGGGRCLRPWNFRRGTHEVCLRARKCQLDGAIFDQQLDCVVQL
jgi:hypothetical protein